MRRLTKYSTLLALLLTAALTAHADDYSTYLVEASKYTGDFDDAGFWDWAANDGDGGLNGKTITKEQALVWAQYQKKLTGNATAILYDGVGSNPTKGIFNDYLYYITDGGASGTVWWGDNVSSSAIKDCKIYALSKSTPDGLVPTTAVTGVTLTDDVDLSGYNGKTLDVTLERTLQHGKWYTLCLPFDVDLTETTSPFYGATVKTLGSYEKNGTTVTVNFADVTSIEAGKPYIIWLAEGDEDLANPVFEQAAITAATASPIEVSEGAATFKGTYAPLTITAPDTKKLFLQDNKLYYPNAETTVPAFRAYIELKEDVPTGAAIKVHFDVDDDATGIATVVSSPKAENWYDLSGRKLNGTPAQRGIYIVNGKKVAK